MKVDLHESDLNNLAFDSTLKRTTAAREAFIQLETDKQAELAAEKETIQATQAKGGSSMVRLRGKPSRDAFDLSCKDPCVIGAPNLLTKEGVLYFEVESLAASGSCSCPLARIKSQRPCCS